MSGIDEQYVDVSECPLCKRLVLTWMVYSADKSTNIGYYNCTSRFKGPDYYHLGSADDIRSFGCNKCHKHIKEGTPFFNALFRSMLNARWVK